MANDEFDAIKSASQRADSEWGKRPTAQSSAASLRDGTLEQKKAVLDQLLGASAPAGLAEAEAASLRDGTLGQKKAVLEQLLGASVPAGLAEAEASSLRDGTPEQRQAVLGQLLGAGEPAMGERLAARRAAPPSAPEPQACAPGKSAPR